MARVRSSKPTRAARAPRRRRDPETARRELLDAAERVFATHVPDDAGLKLVADEAGVSHALITHYFGTYRGLVEATLARRQVATRARVLERLAQPEAIQRPDELLAIVFESLDDPVHLRLLRWLLANERADAGSLGLGDRGLKVIAARAAAAMPEPPSPDKLERLELALLTSVAAAFGWAVGKHMLATGLGRAVTRELDDSVRRTLAHMIQAYVRNEVGPGG
jgi:AcrR family transcriptional regulator|nr:TetR/AcrR family transcriptional regulator [Kofleriaceae bacterium]